MGVYNGMGKPLFRAGQFGQPIVQSPSQNVVISQTGQVVPINPWNQRQRPQQQYGGAFSQAAMQQMQQAMNQMAGIHNVARGFNGQNDLWFGAKYTRDEVEMAINQKCKFRNVLEDLEGTIKQINPSGSYYAEQIKIELSWMLHGSQTYIAQPTTILEIPFIDKLRKTKLYKMVK